MSFFKRKSLFIILIGIILLGILVGYSFSKQNNLSTAEKFVMDTVGWVQNIIYQPVTFVVGFFENIDDMKKTYDENKILREKLFEYKTLVYDLQELEKENEELRNVLQILESPRDYEPILASVIARSPERWIEQVTINQGSQKGIEENMAVITGEGMIGKVKSVSTFTSTVQLISSFDQFSRVSANVLREKENNVFGLIEGYDEEKGMLLFRVIEQSGEKLKEDELVVSSNLGGLFPSGLTIGTIDEVTMDPYGLTEIAYVKPTANLKEINEVIVVKRLQDVVDNEPEVTDQTEEDSEENEE